MKSLLEGIKKRPGILYPSSPACLLSPLSLVSCHLPRDGDAPPPPLCPHSRSRRASDVRQQRPATKYTIFNLRTEIFIHPKIPRIAQTNSSVYEMTCHLTCPGPVKHLVCTCGYLRKLQQRSDFGGVYRCRSAARCCQCMDR